MVTKLRAACDNCHRGKVRCSGQLPCQGCLNTGTLCFFSLSDRLGRPKGTKNRSSEEVRKQSNARKAVTTTRRANNNKGRAPNNKDSLTTCLPATAATLSANNTPDMNDHELNGSSSEDSYNGRLDFLDLLDNQAPFDGSLNINPNDSDFSNLLWTNPSANFMQEARLSNDNEVMLDPLSAPSTAPHAPMNTLLSKQAASTTNSCACMQQQVDLLFKSKILSHYQPNNNNKDGPTVTLDVALALVEEGLKAWQTPIMCTSCRCNDDQEVILLAFMSIQAITRYFQRLLIRNRAQLNGTPQSQHVDPSQCPAKALLTVGAFQVQGEDRFLLLKTLVLNTVRKLIWILTSLQKVLEEKIARFPPNEAVTGDATHSQLHGDSFYIQHMFHGLGGTLQSIQETLS